MPVPILCPCSAKLRVRDALAGLEIQCPKCLAIHRVEGEMPGNGRAEPTSAAPDAEEVLARSGFSSAEQEKLERELEKNEQLLWAGKPSSRIPFYLGWAIAGGCFVLAGVLGFMVILASVQGHAGGVVCILLGGVALLVLLAGLPCPFINRRRYEQTAYALTSKRALVWDCDWLARPRFKDYGPEDLAAYHKLQFSQRPDAVGHIVFAREVTRAVGTARIVRSHGFFYVTGVPDLEKLIREHLLDPYTDRILQ